MSLPNAFVDAVNNKNIRSIRIMMKNSLLVDTTFREYNEMERAVSGIPEVFVAHDGKELIEDKSQWNEEYISRVMTQVIGNFSHERVNHLKEVVRYLRPPVTQSVNAGSNKKNHENNVRRPNRAAINGQSEYQRQKAIDQANGNFRPEKIAICAGIGAAAGATIMAAASGPIILGAVGGAAVGAGAAAIATSGDK